jgi:hypothetical protein
VRRLPGLCYLCGEPVANEWFCPAHLWASSLKGQPGYLTNGRSASDGRMAHLGRFHAYWIDRLPPEEVVALARHIGPMGAA